ncbi:CvpA family protein [Oceanicoccus sp. KOV_DT_Chl]|uniref:CvpA family protein n=1 Tax=Oceanicoccus sp. KOV_DT_Chl TaxID=1904639 RepID=UPI000C7BAD48|nr:CvpA family protein [Oceanicoccus sp. KOV_DT_Chl]
MNWADWTIVSIITISSLLSIKRGFVKEAISLAIWALAFFISVAFHERLAVLLEDLITSPSLRYLLSFAVLFAATLVVGAMVKYLVGELVKMTGLSGTDRLFGMAFGFVRGVIIVMALLILSPMAVPVNNDGWWQQSLLIPHFLLIEHWCKDSFSFLLEFFGQWL